MSAESSKRSWEERMSGAGTRIEEELRRIVNYINDEVVPQARVNGSGALRAAATELQKLADYMDSRRTDANPDSPQDDPKS